jgi:hypothetical protein
MIMKLIQLRTHLKRLKVQRSNNLLIRKEILKLKVRRILIKVRRGKRNGK